MVPATSSQAVRRHQQRSAISNKSHGMETSANLAFILFLLLFLFLFFLTVEKPTVQYSDPGNVCYTATIFESVNDQNPISMIGCGELGGLNPASVFLTRNTAASGTGSPALLSRNYRTL
jgi:hypothetical protein